MVNYRKLYEAQNGPIPVDENGRTYEIHHIDGDRTNNEVGNLVALSIEDHYNIHYEQGDWGACQSILIRMKRNPKEISEMARKAGIERARNGTLNLLDGKAASKSAIARVKAGTHHLLDGNISRKTQAKRIAEGTHHLLGGEIQRRNNKKRLDEGTHHLTLKKECPHCGFIGAGAGMYRFHFDKCKKRKKS